MLPAMALDEPRLTSLSHGGGCGCKIAPAVLSDILRRTPAAAAFPDLLVGTETGDDAAVWRLNAEPALVATTALTSLRSSRSSTPWAGRPSSPWRSWACR